MFFPRRPHYFSEELDREVVELYWHTTLYNLALNLSFIFEPIFLYALKFSLAQIMFFYVLVYFGYSILIFPATKIAARIGYKHAIFISGIFYIVYWIGLYQIKFHPSLFLIVPFFFALQKSFFWPSYDADVAISSAQAQRGREVGVLFSLVELASIIGPVIGGLLSFKFGFPVLFSVSALIMLVSTYPLFLSPEIYTKHQFHFKNFWHLLRRYPYNFFGYWGYAEDLMLMSLWPLYMFLIVPQLFSVGLITTFASFVAVMLMLYIGKLFDGKNRLPLLQIGSVFYGLTWIYRFFATTMGSVVGFDIATRLGKGLVNVPLISTTYGIAGTNGPDRAIAYSVFYEFSLSIGKIFTALVAIWILGATRNIPMVFMFVGVMTMFYGLIRKK